MLSKLKQLCNHPALYLKEPFEDAETMLARSTKLERIVQMALRLWTMESNVSSLHNILNGTIATTLL